MRSLRRRDALTLLSCAAVAGVAQAAPIRLTVATYPDLDRALKLALPAFARLHPGVVVNIVSLAHKDHHTAMTTALAAGAALPDLIALDMDFMGKFLDSAGLEDLSRPPFHAAVDESRIARFAWRAGVNRHGEIKALPVDVGPGALFYRQDLLARAGLQENDLTASWTGFIAAGRKLRAATGAYLVAHAQDLKDIRIRAGLSDGEGVFFDAQGRSLVRTERFQRAFELALQARDAGIDARVRAWTNEWAEGFRRDAIAAQMMGSWLGGHLKHWIAPATAGKWRSAPLPEGVAAAWGGSFYAIPVHSRQKALAWDLLRLLSLDRDQQLAAFRSLDAFPVLLSAQDDDFLAEPIAFLGGEPARLQWRDMARRVPALALDRYDAVADEVVRNELDLVLQRRKDIGPALADARAAIERRVRRRPDPRG
ncbi:MAG: carbohydrate ABC transporter substrate-binding protein [Mitsuaria chitosanitabida]|uniref:ABC transporter substrate-binding protein n=1 Tax=Roseateles chitosanitabidus TaxID=65048 RepID=UPI001B169EC3|nr:ABC transporter substrate-binding protein [Roseateles chitosanitabidus]MBO9686114.1 carbohydrate ABC transporter substrate-binding protein [Roseateles chitosanitabidus]